MEETNKAMLKKFQSGLKFDEKKNFLLIGQILDQPINSANQCHSIIFEKNGVNCFNTKLSRNWLWKMKDWCVTPSTNKILCTIFIEMLKSGLKFDGENVNQIRAIC